MEIIRVIIVEDSEDDLLLLLRALKKGEFEPIYTRVETEEELRETLQDERWQLVISDHALPRFSAPEALEVVKETGRDIPFIIVSGTIGEEIAVEAMRSGAHDYIMKGNLARLAPAIRRELGDAVVREEKKRYAEELKFMALHDPLTGLYNRNYFENEINRLHGGSVYPVTIIAADLDGLKLINDTVGTREGDRILKACADLLARPLRKGDILARLGGDEFGAILACADDRVAQTTVEQIQLGVTEYNKKNQEMPISLSLGYAISYGDSEPLEDTFKKAVDAMQIDKQNRAGSARSQVVKVLLAALSERDFITGGHAERLQELCEGLGQMIGLSFQQLTVLNLLAQVHDLGKVGIPDRILFKKGPLDDQEWEVMRRHPEIGFRIAQASPELEPVAGLILRHHERWDGSGYPLSLKGEEIPIECRILAIVDAYDAMTNDRPYSKAKSQQEAVNELKAYAGIQFDPNLVELFLTLLK